MPFAHVAVIARSRICESEEGQPDDCRIRAQIRCPRLRCRVSRGNGAPHLLARGGDDRNRRTRPTPPANRRGGYMFNGLHDCCLVWRRPHGVGYAHGSTVAPSTSRPQRGGYPPDITSTTGLHTVIAAGGLHGVNGLHGVRTQRRGWHGVTAVTFMGSVRSWVQTPTTGVIRRPCDSDADVMPGP